MHDGKAFCGKVCLTNFEVHRLQNYYAIAIMWNVNNLEANKRPVWAIFITSCQYLKNLNLVSAQVVMKVDVNSRTMPFRACIWTKAFFTRCSSTSLQGPCYCKFLKWCLHGKTQNPNESLNIVIWTKIHEKSFCKAWHIQAWDIWCSVVL